MTYKDLPKRKKGKTKRLIVASSLFLLQLALLSIGLSYLNIFMIPVYVLFEVISVLFVIKIIYSDANPTYKMSWIIFLFAIPFYGLLLYSMWGRGRYPRAVRKKIEHLKHVSEKIYPQKAETYFKLMGSFPQYQRTALLLQNSGFPIYDNTKTVFYPTGEEFFEALIAEIKMAEKYIYLEFFIISEGVMWDMLYSLLKEKAAAGLDVRLMYDDFGCISTLPRHFNTELEKNGIKCLVFNPVIPFLNNFYINYRNHRKICIIDGYTGFTGGVNIADEYINIVQAYGHWKDSGVMLKGEGVCSFNAMFYQMWEYATQEGKMHSRPALTSNFSSQKINTDENNAFVQPFADGPLNNPRNPAEMLYMQTINEARKYIYLTTPYLVLDNEMITALKLAAQSGVDVRIITPGIPDKKYVFMVTRSFYRELLKSGVRIYEYTPGFIHAKNVVCDDDSAIVGTINLDFRSFYLHFEDGVWMCGSQAVLDVRDDFLSTLEECREVTYGEWKKWPWYIKILQVILKLFAPLL